MGCMEGPRPDPKATGDSPVSDSSPTPDPTLLPDSALASQTAVPGADYWQWMNPPTSFSFSDSGLQVKADKGSDFFNNPEDSSKVATAPFLYREVSGDFVARIQVKPDFSSQWNAVALMAYRDSDHWIKFAYENSDATGPTLVSVVTDIFSDDANGAIVEDKETVWLKMVRKGPMISMHWSTDNQTYYLSRLTSLPWPETLRIGVEFQSPVGASAVHELLAWRLDMHTVENMRNPEH